MIGTRFDFRDGSTKGRSLVLYGAGNAGRQLARKLRCHGIAVSAFIDASAAKNDVREGLPVYTLQDWLKTGHVTESEVLVCVHNPYVDVATIWADLRSAGVARLLSMVDFINAFPDDLGDLQLDCLRPATFYGQRRHLIDGARALLCDDLSRVWFDAIMLARHTGDYGALPKPCPTEQYVTPDLPRWKDPMRFIDCGAYDGDTIALMLRHGYRVEAVAAYEPDPYNYAKLVRSHPDLDAIFLRCGVSSTATLVNFDGGHGISSRISSAGETTIQCLSIDEALPSFAPTLIKMDIEGAEPSALRGAERTIRRHRPGLAIALYHQPEHLWEIPLWLAGLDLGYKMYLRGHLYCGYELIFYCQA